MTTFGEISWNDNVEGFDKKNVKDLFLKLEEGENEIRLLTLPHQYLVHRYKINEKDKWGSRVNCSAIHGDCPLCAIGDKAKPRWLLGVISRKTGEYKILDISYAVYSQIRKLARNTRWGDPTKYDLNIVVDKNGGPTGYYSVQPIPHTPLSAEDQVLRDNVDLDDLKRRVTPPTSDKVVERLTKLNNGVPVNLQSNTQASENTVDMSDDEDDDFPSYKPTNAM